MVGKGSIARKPSLENILELYPPKTAAENFFFGENFSFFSA